MEQHIKLMMARVMLKNVFEKLYLELKIFVNTPVYIFQAIKP